MSSGNVSEWEIRTFLICIAKFLADQGSLKLMDEQVFSRVVTDEIHILLQSM